MEVKGGESVRMNDRQQQLISLLCQRRSDSIQNLAMELGVCERTIRRDIEELTLTYPIETVRGRYGGGVRMADWYFQDRPKLTPKQTALLKRLAKSGRCSVGIWLQGTLRPRPPAYQGTYLQR